MGQGAWTALAQIAADGLGLDLARVEFRMGSSDLPNAGIAGGSSHTATAGAAIYNAGADVIAQLAEIATGDQQSPLFGAGNAGRDRARRPSAAARRREPRRELCGYPGPRRPKPASKAKAPVRAIRRHQENYAMHAHGAVFAEVKVDPDLGQIRVTRLVGAFAAGRIINPRMVRSQYFGGMIWGVSFALHEHAVLDPPLRPADERQPWPNTMCR